MHVVDLICPIALVAWGVWMISPPWALIAAGALWTIDNWRSPRTVAPAPTEAPSTPENESTDTQ